MKYVIFDGNAVLHRAYHALPPLTTLTGEPINAVHGMLSMMFHVIETLDPKGIVFAFDTKEPTFRNEMSKEYQSNRPEVDQDLISQFEKARVTLKSFKVPYFEKPGFEADDIIGTIARIVSEEGNEAVVVTGDRDLLQLVTDRVSVCMPIRGVKEALILGPNEVLKKMGVWPNQIVDYKALVGDASDNYKGVPGIGPKTAEALLKKYSSLESIIENVLELPKSTGEKIKNNLDSAYLSKKLATIDTHVPVEIDTREMTHWELDSKESQSLMAAYGFKSLPKKALEIAQKLSERKQLQLF